MTTVLEQLAHWAASVAPNHPAVAFERAVDAFEDVIGCMIAGSGDPGVDAVRRAVCATSPGGCSAIGWRDGTTSFRAALVNATAAHALDFDDEFLPALTHATAVLASALLALAEERSATGEEILDAYIVGLELHAALGRGVLRSHYDAGWHATSTIGTIGTAGACARLLKLGPLETAHAMSLGVSMAAGCKVQFGSMAKPLHAGLVAQHAIDAAMLAACGVQGRLDALEGPMGFLELYGGPSPLGWSETAHQPERPLAIVSDGLMAKRFPCCTAMHRVLEGALRLRRELEVGVDEIGSVETLVGYGHRKNLRFDDPGSPSEARFSLPYCLSTALIFGDLVISDFEPAAIRRDVVRNLMRRISVSAHPPGAEQQDASAVLPHRIRIVFRNGRILETTQANLKGSLENPLTEQEKASKFSDCCRALLDDRDVRGLRRLVKGLRSAHSIVPIVEVLRAGLGRR